MTTIADLISRADRDRLLKRLAEWRDLDGAMRERGSLAALPPPIPLHKMASATAEPSRDHRPRPAAGQ